MLPRFGFSDAFTDLIGRRLLLQRQARETKSAAGCFGGESSVAGVGDEGAQAPSSHLEGHFSSDVLSYLAWLASD